MCGWDYDPGVVPYLRRAGLAPRAAATYSSSSQWGWGFRTVRGSIDPKDDLFRLRFVEVVDVWIHL